MSHHLFVVLGQNRVCLQIEGILRYPLHPRAYVLLHVHDKANGVVGFPLFFLPCVPRHFVHVVTSYLIVVYHVVGVFLGSDVIAQAVCYINRVGAVPCLGRQVVHGIISAALCPTLFYRWHFHRNSTVVIEPVCEVYVAKIDI